MTFEDCSAGARGRRVIPLPAVVADALASQRQRQERDKRLAGRRWNPPPRRPVFATTVGTPTDARNALRVFQRRLAAAGLPPMRLYDLRHGAASFLCALGVSLHDAMAILGHSQASTLLNVYAHSVSADRLLTATPDANARAD